MKLFNRLKCIFHITIWLTALILYSARVQSSTVFHHELVKFRGFGCNKALSVSDVTLRVDGSLYINLQKLKPALKIHERQSCTIILPFTSEIKKAFVMLKLDGVYHTPNAEKIMTIIRSSLSGDIGRPYVVKITNSSEGEFSLQYPFSLHSTSGEINELKIVLTATVGNPDEVISYDVASLHGEKKHLFLAASGLTVMLKNSP